MNIKHLNTSELQLLQKVNPAIVEAIKLGRYFTRENKKKYYQVNQENYKKNKRVKNV